MAPNAASSGRLRPEAETRRHAPAIPKLCKKKPPKGGFSGFPEKLIYAPMADTVALRERRNAA